MMGSILLKEDQPVTCEGLYLQALEVFDKKKTMTRPELFDYSKACDGYSQLLVKWDKRERLGEGVGAFDEDERECRLDVPSDVAFLDSNSV